MSGSLAVVPAGSIDETIAAAGRPLLVDVTADWCPPCHAIAPVLAEIATEQAGRLDVVSLDADTATAFTRAHGILSLPTLLLFVDGVEVLRLVGARPKAALLEEFAAYL